MPLFEMAKGKLSTVTQANFPTEKHLQTLIEQNLHEVFNCRLVASEFATGAQHAGRIDTLGLSEDSNPVIIEYKKVESSDLINQSLFYLSWLTDHRGDFELAAQRALGAATSIDWSAIRVICIAPNYKRYDLHAVQMMGAAIELWTYRLFRNDTIYLEEVFQRSVAAPSESRGLVHSGAPPLTAGKKAALTRATGVYTFDEHIADTAPEIVDLALAVNDYVTGLDPSIQVAPKKYYVAYKLAQNVVCMEVKKRQVVLYVKLDPSRHKGPPGLSRDVSKIGHVGTGDLEITLKSLADLEASRSWIELAYRELGS